MKNEDSKKFYNNLLNKALDSIEGSSSLVVGNIFSSRDKEKNKGLIKEKIEELRNSGVDIFNQLPFLDENLENAPFEYELKFEIFYKGLIHSGKINKLFVLPNFVDSVGAKKEILFAEEKLIEIEYLK